MGSFNEIQYIRNLAPSCILMIFVLFFLPPLLWKLSVSAHSVLIMGIWVHLRYSIPMWSLILFMHSNFYEVCRFWWLSVHTLWFLSLRSLCLRNRFQGHKERHLARTPPKSVHIYEMDRSLTFIISYLCSVKNLPVMWETKVWSPGQEDPLEKGMATHSSILARRIPWTEELGRLQSLGSQRVRHSWVTNAFTFLFNLPPQWNCKILTRIKHHSTK